MMMMGRVVMVAWWWWCLVCGIKKKLEIIIQNNIIDVKRSGHT